MIGIGEAMCIMNKINEPRMKIAFIGLGKLGLPVALAIESKGFNVKGWDIDPKVSEILKTKKLPYQEQGAQELLEKTEIELKEPEFLKDWADILFIAVQTPHDNEYEGITPLPISRKDFDYTFLKQACESVRGAKLVVIISTVLPGTIEREILPILPDVIYNPFFIAMGTTIQDFLNPEFVLLGGTRNEILDNFYWSCALQKHGEKFSLKLTRYWCSIREAEIIKVSYNTFITAKICIANTIMELCHKLGASSDVVTDALGLATERLISTKYLRGGMGDGGGCHPRDNIALSWLAKELNLSYDLYEKFMNCRDRQTQWLANLIEQKAREKNLPVVILGKAFKANTNLTTGSPAMLLTHYLNIGFTHYDPFIDKEDPPIKEKAIYFVATNHDVFKRYEFPEGSEVIDVWRYLDNATIKIG